MMPAEKVAVLQAFAVSAAYYGRPISDDVAGMYLHDVRDLAASSVLGALQALRREPKRRTCPLPAEVRAYVERKQGGQSAEQAAARLAGAISMFGHTRATQARAYMGEAAWQTVMDLGGWASICSRVTTSEIGTFVAQARDLCRVHLDAPPVTQPAKTALPEAAKKRLSGLVEGIG